MRNLCDLIGLKKYKTNVSVSGLNKTVIPIDSRVSVSISNKEGSYIKTLDFFLVPTITEDLVPTTKIDFNLNNIPNLKLADKNFNIPERVQMLLGAEVFYELMLPGQFKTEGSNVIFQNTVFGFIVSGSTSSDAQGKEHCGFIQAADNLEHSIKKFWEIENVEIDSVKTSELDICEDHFKSTHSRDDQGRYTVAMPLKEDPSCLGESRQTAIQRLNSLWKRLSRDKEYLSLYEKFLQEYEDLGHMREIKADGSGVSFYMPHHGVYRPEKSTTKLRTVFNASSPSTSGKSLNSIQFNGGLVQEDLFSIMVRFRKHKRANKNVRVNYSHLRTVSTPYLATLTLKQLAMDEANNFPLAAPVVLSDCYMDDILSGSESIEEVIELQHQ
ncbi:integrase catalytic domain-containing protein [Trichonephila clavipes]|nr:integrase catalytic domain-containing protein [Trichonephila clavipes]